MTTRKIVKLIPAIMMVLCLVFGQAGVFAAEGGEVAEAPRAFKSQPGGRRLKPISELTGGKSSDGQEVPAEEETPSKEKDSGKPPKEEKPVKNPGKINKPGKDGKEDAEYDINAPIDDTKIPADWATGNGNYPARFIELENRIRSGQSDAKIAYLTFDDGPYIITDQYLATLAQYNVRGTFFVIGKPAQQARYMQIAQGGHAFGNHTYSHGIFTGLYSSPESFIGQVDLLENYLYDLTGIRTNFVRFPGGSPTAAGYKPAMVQLLRDKGYGYVDWTAYSGDGFSGPLDAETAYQTVIRTVGNQQIAVVLMHDYSAATAAALPRIIETLRAKGYLLLPLTYESCMINK